MQWAYAPILLGFLIHVNFTTSHPQLSASPRPRVPVSRVSASPRLRVSASPRPRVSVSAHPEYLWYEAENMRGFATDPRGEPILNPSWRNLPKDKAPGWGINGPGVSAEWSQGGESEWNSAAASADETKATIYQDIEVPQDGDYKVWVRYADWAGRTENFTIRIEKLGDTGTRGSGDAATSKQRNEDAGTRRHGDAEKTTWASEVSASPRPRVPASHFSASPYPRVPASEVSASPRPRVPASQFSASPHPRVPVSISFSHEFGAMDIIDPHDEVSMYWRWAFAWDSTDVKLEKGDARISIEIDKPASARRHVDCVLVTNDATYVPNGRSKPDFAGMRYLREWNHGKTQRASLSSLIQTASVDAVPRGWQRPKVGGRDFVMPWNIANEFWQLYDKPEADRPVYPFNAEPIEQFVEKYKGARDVPIFASKLVVPVIYIPNLPEYLKEGSPFLRYLRETKAPFAVLINYGSAQFSETEEAAAWKLLTGELRDQFIGWISGESIGYVWDSAASELKVSQDISRRELLEKYRIFYTNALDRKWSTTFQTPTGPMWDKLIPAQSTSSTSYAHALANWGVRLLGMETPTVQPMFAMRIAFTRGAARQYGGAFLYYHAPNFGDTATTFTNRQNFGGPNNFFHSRYGATMGPSLSWYRKTYYLYYMAGASAIYLEQGFDQFFKPGPGEHPFELNPLGRITDEFVRFAERHPDRGVPYTPIAFLLDPAHGWDMTDYPQWPFGVSQINRGDRALRELFGVAYYPGLVVEGEPATGDRQAFVNGIFGDIFDVIVASDAKAVPSSEFRVPSSAFSSDVAASPRLRVPSSPRLPVSPSPLMNYRAVVAGGRIEWSPTWITNLTEYVRNGGTIVLNAAQIKGLPEQLLGVRVSGSSAESDNAKCLQEPDHDLSGQMFRYAKVELKGATTLMATPGGDPLVTVNKLGKGTVVFNALTDLLGMDERVTPFSAHMLAHVFSNATPVRVHGEVEYLINRTDTGWVVTLFNNKGVYKPQQGLAQVDRSAVVSPTISIPGKPIRSATEWITDKRLGVQKQGDGDDSVIISIPPGGIAIVELK